MTSRKPATKLIEKQLKLSTPSNKWSKGNHLQPWNTAKPTTTNEKVNKSKNESTQVLLTLQRSLTWFLIDRLTKSLRHLTIYLPLEWQKILLWIMQRLWLNSYQQADLLYGSWQTTSLGDKTKHDRRRLKCNRIHPYILYLLPHIATRDGDTDVITLLSICIVAFPV